MKKKITKLKKEVKENQNELIKKLEIMVYNQKMIIERQDNMIKKLFEMWETWQSIIEQQERSRR